MRSIFQMIGLSALIALAVSVNSTARAEVTAETGVKSAKSLLCKAEWNIGSVGVSNPIAGSTTEGACNCLDAMVNFFTAAKGVKADIPQYKSMAESLAKELGDANNTTTASVADKTAFAIVDTAAQGVFKNMAEVADAITALGDDASCASVNNLAAKLSSFMLSLQGLGDVVNNFMKYIGPDGGTGTINYTKFAENSKAWADKMIVIFKPIQGVLAAVTCLASICTDLPKLLNEYSSLQSDPSFQEAIKPENQLQLIADSYSVSDNPVQGVLAATVATVAIAGNNYGDAAVSALGLDATVGPSLATGPGNTVLYHCCWTCGMLRFSSNFAINGRDCWDAWQCGYEVVHPDTAAGPEWDVDVAGDNSNQCRGNSGPYWKHKTVRFNGQAANCRFVSQCSEAGMSAPVSTIAP